MAPYPMVPKAAAKDTNAATPQESTNRAHLRRSE